MTKEEARKELRNFVDDYLYLKKIERELYDEIFKVLEGVTEYTTNTGVPIMGLHHDMIDFKARVIDYDCGDKNLTFGVTFKIPKEKIKEKQLLALNKTIKRPALDIGYIIKKWNEFVDDMEEEYDIPLELKAERWCADIHNKNKY